ncbi:phosphoribosyltransferase family protein [Bacillus sp. V3B]|uniref:phosphoribosyltransferase family protein n=1 Tax=Bacillus sp. V3B TaxID=2804915 RepID=UPI00210C2B2B|nr:phosphoribosyltransferase family protein [Bacillus sp. V3B]MCQ6275561.1 phosphoribosyltransferase family protein [Bacillus sp. V3B]
MKRVTVLQKETYNVLDDLRVEVEVLNNPYHFQLDQLFQMATRINKKRSFLFVSKVLGKHLAVNPAIPLLVGSLLSLRYMEMVYGLKDPRAQKIAEAIQTNTDIAIEGAWASMKNSPISLPRPTTFIGFAETATALGHSVFSTFANHAKYIHTTREQIDELTSVITFEEEHSHATSHRVYAMDSHFFNDDNEVVLVDDEITTGKTALNIIRTIKANYPLKKVFTVVSILDWRTQEHREEYRQLERELEVKIHAISLIDGVVSVTGEPVLEEKEMESTLAEHQEITYIPIHHFMNSTMLHKVTSTTANGTENQSPYLQTTGRFGLSIESEEEFSHQSRVIANYLKEYRKGGETLVIGTGEFMYVPMRVASEMGPDIYFQSTTRSPIYQTDRESYTIQQKFEFDSPENSGVINHLYNIESNQYDEIFIFVERMSALHHSHSLIAELRKTKIPYIHIVTMTETIE